MEIVDLPVIVTGAASGLGAATARHLSERGARVVLMDRSIEGARVAAEVVGHLQLLDVTDPGSIASAVAAAVDWFGPPRALVHCAGVMADPPDTPRDAGVDTLLDINLQGSLAMVAETARAMARAEPNADGARGCIVLTGAEPAFASRAGSAGYAASKAGITAMVPRLARDLAPEGIRVNALAPGAFATPMLDRIDGAARAALIEAAFFPARAGAPSEFAHAAAFLIENGYVNGTTLRLDAGAGSF